VNSAHESLQHQNAQCRSDLYGRFWLPSEINILLTGVPSSAASIDTSDASNKPP
ncbi:unnamed protein product, partial [Brassica napus]